MRVALACPYAWDVPGGVQGHVAELAEHLRERRHVVVVLAPAARRVDDPGVRVVGRTIRVPYGGSVAPISPSPGTFREVRNELRRFSPDLVHVHEPFTPSASMFAALAARAPVVATFHSGIDRSRLLDLAWPVLRLVDGRITERIAVSERAAAFVGARSGHAYHIIPNGIDVARFGTARAAELGPGSKLLFVGRLDVRKGFPVAVAAFRELASERPDIRLLVVGDGHERGAVDLLPPEIRSRVSMLGTVANAELPGIHAAADVFVAPSLGGESFGIVLVEAMAAGLPVVASRIPGYAEVLGDVGVLVPPRDPSALAEAVRAVLDDLEHLRAMGEAGRARAADYDWGTVTDRIEVVYRDAVDRHGPR